MLEVVSLEVPIESVRTVAGVQSWRQRISNFGRCNREAQAPNAVRANGTVSRLVFEDFSE